MNKQRQKRILKQLQRYNQWYEEMEETDRGDYVKFTDVADLLKSQFGIDIHDPVVAPSEPKFTVHDCVIEGNPQPFESLYKNLFNNENWASSIGMIGRAHPYNPYPPYTTPEK